MPIRFFILIVLTAGLSSAKDEGFNGKWVIDKTASTATVDIPDNLTQQIKKKGDSLAIETFWREPRNGMAPLMLLGVMTTQLKLALNGQDTTNWIGPFQQVSKTSQSGNQLVTDWQAMVNGQHVKGHWTRTISDDGRTMTLEIQESTDDGKNNSGKLLFKRK